MFVYSLHNDHVWRFIFSQLSLAHSTAHASRSLGSVAVCLSKQASKQASNHLSVNQLRRKEEVATECVCVVDLV